MSNLWQFFINHWLAIFWVVIVAALVIVGMVKLYDEILFRIERRRYRRTLRS
ncbi:hypothetical protein SEA_KARDASHIAN_70 [Streptomyces phage Kardashian]|nr:hypothetical protein SEA_KARDASHIAN_70 [Streptomyces phage Kardashian]